MLNILRKTTASLTKTTRYSSADQDGVVVGDDISTWEFVNASLSDDEDIYSFDGDHSTTVESESKKVDEEDPCESRDLEAHQDDIISLQPPSMSPPKSSPTEVTRHHALDDDDDEEDDYDVEEDVDDELMPWKLKDRFGKQRMKKIGKRGVPKHSKSKRLPYYLNRPGCSYVKHALCVQHSYI